MRLDNVAELDSDAVDEIVTLLSKETTIVNELVPVYEGMSLIDTQLEIEVKAEFVGLEVADKVTIPEAVCMLDADGFAEYEAVSLDVPDCELVTVVEPIDLREGEVDDDAVEVTVTDGETDKVDENVCIALEEEVPERVADKEAIPVKELVAELDFMLVEEGDPVDETDELDEVDIVADCDEEAVLVTKLEAE